MTLAAFSFTTRWRPLVEVGVGDTRAPVGVGAWETSLWGDPGATWNGAEPIWEDVSCFVHEVSTDTGRDWSVDRFTPGVCDVTASNATGWASDVSDPSRTVRAGRQLRVSIVDNLTGVVQPLFRGFIDAKVPSYNGVEPDLVVLHCIDGLGEIGLYQRSAALLSPVGNGDTGNARFHRILTEYGWPPAWIGEVDDSPVTMSGTLWEQSFADELGITADSEGGAIVATRDGHMTFRARDWMTWPAGAGLRWSIGNQPGDICPDGFELSEDRADVANQVSYSRAAGGAVPQIAVDLASQGLYGVLPLSRADLICQSDSQVNVLARRTVEVKADGGERVRSATLSAPSDPTRIIPLLLQAEVSTVPPIRADLHVDRPDGTRVDQTGVLQRVSHEFSQSRWTCRLGFDLADPYIRPVAHWNTASWSVENWSSAVTLEEVA